MAADNVPDSREPFGGDSGGFIGWRHQRWEWMDYKSQEAAKALGYNSTRWESAVRTKEIYQSPACIYT